MILDNSRFLGNWGSLFKTSTFISLRIYVLDLLQDKIKLGGKLTSVTYDDLIERQLLKEKLLVKFEMKDLG